MKTVKTGLLSGCLIWFFACGLAASCLIPIALMVGGISSTLAADNVAGMVSPLLCPAGSTGEITTYQTTIRDDNGVDRPSTAYEMRCVDAGGQVVRDSNPDYAFVWIGLLAAGGLVLSGLLAIALAAPVGTLIGRFFGKK
jgi:hypothetical protein